MRPEATREPPDVRRLARRAKIDPEAFAVLYDLHVDRVFAFAYRRLGSRADAEDVTAETFLTALANISRFEWRGGGFAAWLFRIARNLCWDTLRSRSRSAPLPADPEDGGPGRGPPVTRSYRFECAGDPEEAALEREMVGRLRRLVTGLPDSQYEIVLLKYASGLTNREIAEATGKSSSAVSSLLHRVTSKLRERLGESRD